MSNNNMIINRKTVRVRRERSLTGSGQAWVCARDFLSAAGLPTPRALNGDFLAGHLGAEAVQTLRVQSGDGHIHRLIYVHAEGLVDLVRLFVKGDIHRVAALALKGAAMMLNVIYSKSVPEALPAKVEPEGKPEVTTHDFNGLSLRVVQIDGEPWFVARDVCLALGVYLGRTSGHVNVTVGVRKLNADEHQLYRIQQTVSGRLTHREVTLVSESGLYKFITRSDKPEAKPFQEWVTRDVLPSIRKTGSYSLTDGLADETALTGEIVQTGNGEAVERSFKALVSNRSYHRVHQIAALQAELHQLELAQEKDEKLLALLTA